MSWKQTVNRYTFSFHWSQSHRITTNRTTEINTTYWQHVQLNKAVHNSALNKFSPLPTRVSPQTTSGSVASFLHTPLQKLPMLCSGVCSKTIPVLKLVWKSWGLPLTTYTFPLSPPSVYHPHSLWAGGWAKSWGLSPQAPLLYALNYSVIGAILSIWSFLVLLLATPKVAHSAWGIFTPSKTCFLGPIRLILPPPQPASR